MLDFVCMSSIDLGGAHGSKLIQNEKLLPTEGLELTILRFVVRISNNFVLMEFLILKGHRHDWSQCLFTKII